MFRNRKFTQYFEQNWDIWESKKTFGENKFKIEKTNYKQTHFAMFVYIIVLIDIHLCHIEYDDARGRKRKR